MSRLAFLLALALAASAAQSAEKAAEKAARPRLCPEDAPEGVRLPPQPGCGTREGAARRDDGFRDLGGIQVKVGGRVGAEYGVRR